MSTTRALVFACALLLAGASASAATHRLTVSKNGTGLGFVTAPAPASISCPSTCEADIEEGTQVTLTEAHDASGMFGGWSGACTGTGNTCTLTMDGPKAVNATFFRFNPLVVQISGVGGGVVNSSPAGIACSTNSCSANFTEVTSVTLTATPLTGYRFNGWTGDCTNATGTCVLLMNHPQSVVADFVQNPAVQVSKAGAGAGTVTSAPAGISCGASCTSRYIPGTAVELTATEATGSVFTGWQGGGCTGTGKCRFTLDTANVAVIATFIPASQTNADIAVESFTAQSVAFRTGEELTYSFQVANKGPDAALEVVVVDTLPANVTFVSTSPYCSHASGTVTCNLQRIPIGSSIPVQVKVVPNAAGQLSSTVTLTSASTDPVPGNNSATIATTIVASARLVNISTRMQVLTGDNVMIGGFIIGGGVPKTVVVRARGPSLVPTGITNPLVNPKLDLYSGQTVIASNDNWASAANAAALQSSGFAPAEAQESAILTTLNPGPYTAIVSGVGNTTGVGIVEVFEVDHPEIPFINIATRGRVLTGNDVMIAGLIIQGSGPKNVVVRARGPSLTATGVPNVLANPQLQLFTGQTQIAANDNWQQAANAATLLASGFAPADPLEAAILITLDPGAYTAIVTGVGGTTGVAIVEVFEN